MSVAAGGRGLARRDLPETTERERERESLRDRKFVRYILSILQGKLDVQVNSQFSPNR